jgi:hypothetical protein
MTSTWTVYPTQPLLGCSFHEAGGRVNAIIAASNAAVIASLFVSLACQALQLVDPRVRVAYNFFTWRIERVGRRGMPKFSNIVAYRYLFIIRSFFSCLAASICTCARARG